MFENSADFFGRIIVYSLDVLGGKTSWQFFKIPSWERKWPLSKKQDGAVALGKHVICTATSWTDVNVAFFGMDAFRNLWSPLIQTQKALHGIWVLSADLTGFLWLRHLLYCSLHLYCAFWVKAPSKGTHSKKKQTCLLLICCQSAKQNNYAAQLSHYSPCLYKVFVHCNEYK